MSRPFTFSVVTPSYNQAQFLVETIESVLSQNGPFAVEHWVVDGGSTDGSVDVMRKYADLVESGRWQKNCANIAFHWVSEKDRGQTHAINKGLRQATGDVCCYLNSDDTLSPGALEKVMTAFQSHPQSDFIYGDGEVIDEHGNLQWKWLSRPYNHKLLASYHFAWNSFSNYIMQQATYWRRSVLDKIGYLDEDLHFAMDVEYWLRAGAAGLVLTHVRENLGRFRMIQGTKSLSSPTAFWEDQLELFRRHQGVRNLPRYLCYYYYNLAMHHDYDLRWASEEGNTVLARWIERRPTDADAISQAARRGYRWSALLAALALQQKGNFERAAEAYAIGVGESPALRLHPLAMLVQLRRVAGAPAVAMMDRVWNGLIAWYRRKRIDYRYHEALPG